MEEMASALHAKGLQMNDMRRDIQKLQEGMVEIELRIIECIPEDLVDQLAQLERSYLSADRKKAVELQEKQSIESSAPVLQYYVTMQVSINGVLKACTVISSEMVSNQRRGVAGSIAAAITAFASMANPIPFAKFGLDVLTAALNKWDERQQKLAVDRVMEIFMGNDTVISSVAEAVARGMAIHRQAELKKEAAEKSYHQQQQQQQQKKGRVKEALRSAVAMCLNAGETDHHHHHCKVRATVDAQNILQAIMDGKLVIINAGASTDMVETISVAILAFIRTKRF